MCCRGTLASNAAAGAFGRLLHRSPALRRPPERVGPGAGRHHRLPRPASPSLGGDSVAPLPAGAPRPPGLPDAPRTPVTLVNVWWTVWICDTTLSNLAAQFARRVEEAGPVKAVVGLTMAADLLDIAAGVLAILVVRRLTRMQLRRATWAGHDSPAEASEQPV
ncbi:DUF4328 domain-containing protein [Streptomyces sp. NPDC006678]|uniref:DUF4328 domain-containing protein n=1 Tax=Streptomyces sp. NPDC006678 TaxID=3157185 RepID=UPI0033D53039